MKPYDIRQPAMPFTPLSSEKRALSSHTGRPPDVAGYTPPVATDSHPQLIPDPSSKKFKPSKKKLQVPSTNPLLPLKHAFLISFSTFKYSSPRCIYPFALQKVIPRPHIRCTLLSLYLPKLICNKQA